MDEKDRQQRQQAVTEAQPRGAGARMAGRRDALPPGTLPGPHEGVQGDEHRDPDRRPAVPPLLEARETVADHLAGRSPAPRMRGGA